MTLFAVSIYWHFPVLIVAFALVYSGTHHDRRDRILREAAGWVVKITGFLAAVSVVLYALSSWL